MNRWDLLAAIMALVGAAAAAWIAYGISFGALRVRAKPPADSLDRIRRDAIAWQDATFGTDYSPLARAKHLLKEATELYAEPSDVEEMADVFLLLARATFTRSMRADTAIKLEKNKRRTWGKPDADGVVEHVR